MVSIQSKMAYFRQCPWDYLDHEAKTGVSSAIATWAVNDGCVLDYAGHGAHRVHELGVDQVIIVRHDFMWQPKGRHHMTQKHPAPFSMR